MDSLKWLEMNENKYNKSVDNLKYVCYNDIRNKENLWSGSNIYESKTAKYPKNKFCIYCTIK